MPKPEWTKYLLGVAILAFSMSACHAINQYFALEDDHIFEEVAEDILEHQTGIDLDFTPNSKE